MHGTVTGENVEEIEGAGKMGMSKVRRDTRVVKVGIGILVRCVVLWEDISLRQGFALLGFEVRYLLLLCVSRWEET